MSDFATFALPVDFTLRPAQIGPSGSSVGGISEPTQLFEVLHPPMAQPEPPRNRLENERLAKPFRATASHRTTCKGGPLQELASAGFAGVGFYY